ncbi:uncharacterized protein DS421_9g273450 [Arachis hypogaea]|nr:uncharacterized protein DS421_9g273450 [Arachis hypogaea]
MRRAQSVHDSRVFGPRVGMHHWRGREQCAGAPVPELPFLFLFFFFLFYFGRGFS